VVPGHQEEQRRAGHQEEQRRAGHQEEHRVYCRSVIPAHLLTNYSELFGTFCFFSQNWNNDGSALLEVSAQNPILEPVRSICTVLFTDARRPEEQFCTLWNYPLSAEKTKTGGKTVGFPQSV